MKKLKEQQGFTLVEILVSIILLGIISMAILNYFNYGLSNISYSRNRDKALLWASNQTEVIYQLEKPLDKNTIVNTIKEAGGIQYDYNNIYEGNNENEIRFFIDDSDPEGYQVLLVVFFQSGERYIDISFFTRKN